MKNVLAIFALIIVSFPQHLFSAYSVNCLLHEAKPKTRINPKIRLHASLIETLNPKTQKKELSPTFVTAILIENKRQILFSGVVQGALGVPRIFSTDGSFSSLKLKQNWEFADIDGALSNLSFTVSPSTDLNDNKFVGVASFRLFGLDHTSSAECDVFTTWEKPASEK